MGSENMIKREKVLLYFAASMLAKTHPSKLPPPPPTYLHLTLGKTDISFNNMHRYCMCSQKSLVH